MAGGDDEDDRESSQWQTAAKTIARSSPLPAIDFFRDRLVRTLYCMHTTAFPFNYRSVSVQLSFKRVLCRRAISVQMARNGTECAPFL